MKDTREFVGFMGAIMRGVLDGSISPEQAKAITGVGNAMLRGLELNMEWTTRMSKSAEESMPLLLHSEQPTTEEGSDTGTELP